jgi:hypothetical protein
MDRLVISEHTDPRHDLHAGLQDGTERHRLEAAEQFRPVARLDQGQEPGPAAMIRAQGYIDGRLWIRGSCDCRRYAGEAGSALL